jgi:hypothetical protein
MSDFITGLRGDLVEAAARERRRGRLGRAAGPLHPRAWRPAAALGALAVAAGLAAIVVALSTLGPPPPQAARLRIVAQVRVGGQPQDAVLAAGSLWVADFSGEVVRLDPASGRVVARIAVDGNPRSIGAGESGVWLMSAAPVGHRSHLSRIDPRTGRIAGRIALASYGGGIAVGAGGVWLVPSLDSGGIERIDPASGAVTARIPFERSEALAVAGNTVWALGNSTLVVVDGATGRAVQRVEDRALDPKPENALAADANGAWVASRTGEALLRIEAGRVVRRIALGAPAGPVALAHGAVWVAFGDEVRGHFRLSRIDVASDRVTATLDLGLRQPKAIVPAARGVWVLTSDGTALLVRT